MAFFAAQFGACDIEWRGVIISLMLTTTRGIGETAPNVAD
jgi:hypothetical protein